MLRDAVIALSLSNLCFITSWRLLLIPASFDYYYHQRTLPPKVEYFTLILVVILLGLIFFIGIRVIRKTENLRLRALGRIVFILILSTPLYGLLAQLDNNVVLRIFTRLSGDAMVARRLLVVIPLTLSLFLTVIAFLKMNATIKLAIRIILILAPLVPITFSQAILLAIKYQSSDKTAPMIALENRRDHPRILWMVFDEFDFRVAFAERPKTVKLPEFDRLMSESLFANNAYPPAGETLLSMPALITGKLVAEAHPEGPDKLMIKFGDDLPAVSWKNQPNIFSSVRALRLNTALFGWYHPYCRIFGDQLTKCDSKGSQVSGMADVERILRGGKLAPPNATNDLFQSLWQDLRTTAFSVPIVTLVVRPHLDTEELARKRAVLVFNDTFQETVEAANNPEIGFILSHWSIPHAPNIYDRSTHQISVTPNHSYLDNLELVDETFGKVRHAMEASGTWENTVVLITSDHWWRPSWKKAAGWTAEDESTMQDPLDRRVPFILKMPGRASEALAYHAPFNTVLIHDLLLAILQGEVLDTKGVAKWLDSHRSIGRSPYDDRTFG
jgi:hypothetical protein